MDWRKSTYSGANGGDCVEVAAAGGVVGVRDTKDRQGFTLPVGPAAWQRFVSGIKAD